MSDDTRTEEPDVPELPAIPEYNAKLVRHAQPARRRAGGRDGRTAYRSGVRGDRLRVGRSSRARTIREMQRSRR